MQTLKTAAIVVLLMTVMYGAYVSLTTPPEPLPDEVENMLVINEEGTLDFDTTLPDSLGELQIHSGSASEPSATSTGPVTASLGSLGAATYDSAVESAMPGPETPGDATVPTVVSLPEAGLPTPKSSESGIRTMLSDGVGAPAAGLEIPAGAELATVSSSPRAYPRTNSTFELPDPSSMVSSFDATPGGDSIPPLAVTGGSSAGIPTAPGAQGVSPIPSLDASANERGSHSLGLANALRTADRLYSEDRRKEALATLSIFYNTPDLSGEQRSELLSRLDPLAREVIYSPRHLLEQPHRVGQSETLIDIATRYDVPWQLLANINQIDDPVAILPGTELKVVRGPFRAEVSVSMKELTLFLGDLYAGRFPIGIGSDPPPQPGTFTVQDKQTSKTYYDATGSPVPAGSPENPYGEIWIDLGGQLCIHGSPSTTNPTDKGCISLAADYADDLYGILSHGSSVTIHR